MDDGWIGVITAPVVGSGAWPAWMALVENPRMGQTLRGGPPDPDSAGDRDRWLRALHAAAAASDAGWLREQRGYVDAHHPDVDAVQGGLTPLQACLLGPHQSPLAARLLVEFGADLTVTTADGATVLHLATAANLPALVEPCVRAGVDVNAPRHDGTTALALAVDGSRGELPMLVTALLGAGAATGSARATSERAGMRWSSWLLATGGRGPAWSGLCCHAVTTGSDDVWIEFPAEWTAYPVLVARLGKGPVRVLRWDEAAATPWARPGARLHTVFPDGTRWPVGRYQPGHPHPPMADPRAYTGIEEIAWEWDWTARSGTGNDERYTLRLRGGELTWRGANTMVRTPIDRFRIEGPPPGTDHEHCIPAATLDHLCRAIGETRRIWDEPASTQERAERLTAWQAAQATAAAARDRR